MSHTKKASSKQVPLKRAFTEPETAKVQSRPLVSSRKRALRRDQEDLRRELFPEIDNIPIYNTGTSDGWWPVPRALPHILRIADELAPKGFPVATTYIDLWLRAFDQGVVKLVGREHEMAYSSGFSGQRAVQTWGKRIDHLERLGFIRLAPGIRGPRGYALLVDPFHVVTELKKTVPESIPEVMWQELRNRAREVGARNLDQT